ncbi:MAG: flagellar biosynthesis protein FlhB [Steroidobacteraceae bacterium]
MAEHDNEDRTESPSQRRLDEARKQGNVPRSRDLSAAMVTLAGGLGMYFMGQSIGGQLLSMMRHGLSFTRDAAMQDGAMTQALGSGLFEAVLSLVPLFGLLLAAAVLAPLALGGWSFSTEALGLKWERLDPIAGITRVFSLRGFIELGKALLRVTVVGIVAFVVLRRQMGQYNSLSVEPIGVAIGHAMSLCGTALIALGGALAFLALVDVPLALWQYHRDLKMTREELRDEAKETEGNPEVKGRIRRLQNEMSRRRMMSEVPKADVIVTNPTHYAVALRYDDKRMRAPIVIAKGTELLALRIREIGTEHKVPIVEAPPLARALHASCELGDEIPARLYAAVAQILTYVYQLRRARRVGLAAPRPPQIELPPG